MKIVSHAELGYHAFQFGTLTHSYEDIIFYLLKIIIHVIYDAYLHCAHE